MRFLLLFSVVTSLLCAIGSEVQVTIHQHRFDFVKSYYNEYGERGISLLIYRHGDSHEKLPLLAVTLEHTSGSCRSRRREEGAYQIKGDTITLYTAWTRSRQAYDAPVGERIQVYRVEENGTITYKSGELYIETEMRGQDRKSGMQYLVTPPKNSHERKALADYIRRVEEQYHATFVTPQRAKTLHQEVAEALAEKHRHLWH